MLTAASTKSSSTKAPSAALPFAPTPRWRSTRTREVGPAQLRSARGLTYVVPVKAPSATGCPAAKAGAPARLRPRRGCPGRDGDYPWPATPRAQIPTDAKPGQRLWLEFEGAWIDFTVVPLAEIKPDLVDNILRVCLTSHLRQAETLR